MKPTYYNNKTKVQFAKINVRFNIDFEDLILAAIILKSDEKKLSKISIISELKKMFENEGNYSRYTAMETDIYNNEAIKEEVEIIVKKLFPDFFELYKG